MRENKLETINNAILKSGATREESRAEKNKNKKN